jgi:catechol 2,3-dioxygenase
MDRIAYGAVELDVTDIGRSLAFWRDLVGLTERSRDAAGAVALGAGDRDLIVLHPGAGRPVLRGHAGLYHVALHLPDGPEFARVLARLAALGAAQAPTDHIFSMASYLTDPDGIGLELTLETPERFAGFEIGPRSIVVRDSEGRRRGPTEPLDLAPVLGWLDDRPLTDPVAPGAFVGHVHLHVPDLAAGVAFQRDVIGFEEHMVMTAIGMADLSAGGRFPHRIAMNVWNGPDAVQPPPGTAGMRRLTLRMDAGAHDAVRGRLAARGIAHEDGPDGLLARDPAGNVMRLTSDRI